MPSYLKYTLIVLAGCLLFFPFLGHVNLFDWDEINFAECAREMIVSKDYLRAQIDYMPFWEKPPLFMWMQVLAMKLFGVGALAARFPNAFIGVTTLVCLFYVGKRTVSEKMGTWWVLLYAATWLPHFYFKSGIIDPSFNLFIFLAFFQVHLIRFNERKLLHAALAGLFLGLAVLTKGPVAILVALLAFAVFLVINKGIGNYKLGQLLLIAVFAFIPVALWMGTAIEVYGQSYGRWFINEFVSYQARLFSTEDADHGGPFFYHFIVLLIGCFPASLFLFQYSRERIHSTPPTRDFTRWMWILFWVVLILFSIVKTKIVHYSSLCYFPLTFLAALQLDRLSSGTVSIKKWVKVLIGIIGSLVAILITALPLAGIFKQKLIPYINDPFAVANFDANVSWSYVECLWGITYLVGIWVAIYLMRKNFRKGMILLCAVQLIVIEATVLHFTPKVEAFTQRAAIDYFQSFQGKDVYVQPLNYKSYANLFYAEKRPFTDSNYRHYRKDKAGHATPEPNEQWLLHGQIDKPAYFICKIQDTGKYVTLPELQKIGGSNGFMFFRRK